MSFTIPTEAEWPYRMFDGLVSTAGIRSGVTPVAGPSALIVADRWVRVHAQRSPCSSGWGDWVGYSTYKHVLSMVGYFSPESEGWEVLWDAFAVPGSGTTSMLLSVTYQDTGLTDTVTLTTTAASRTVQRDTGFTLTNFAPGPFIAKVELKNSLSNGYHFGLTLVEIPLSSI